MGQLANKLEDLMKSLREKLGGKDMESKADAKLDQAENYARRKLGMKPKGYDDPSKDSGKGVYKRDAKDQTAASGKQTSDTGGVRVSTQKEKQ